MKLVPPSPAIDDCYLVIEIGGTKLQIMAGTAGGRFVDRRRCTVSAVSGAGGIRAEMSAALPALIANHQPRAIGVGYDGPVDWRTGRIVKSYHVAGRQDFPLGQWLAEFWKIPIFVENDANVAALAVSVSGNSPNLVKAFEWVNDHDPETTAIVGAKRGHLAEIARQTIVIEDTHYGRVEDAQMHILHMLCSAFMEVPEMARA